MQLKFILPANYQARTVRLVLSRERNGWRFYGESNGYAVIARNHKGEPLATGTVFSTRGEAALAARFLKLPPYAIWNGRTKRYDGHGAEFIAAARNASVGGL